MTTEPQIRERRFTVLLRFLHLHGGVMYEEKLPRCHDTLREMRREGLVGFEQSDGTEVDRAHHVQVRVSDKGRTWLKDRNCHTFGWERRHGLRQWDHDFSNLILKGELPDEH